MSHFKETPIRGLWSSRFGFILAATGAAVGVGNIWKFPYMVGDYGGSAFVLAYIIGIAILGIPVMLAEILIGRRGRHNPVDSMKILAKEAKAKPYWQAVAWLGLFTLLLVLSFYSVVAGWSLSYLVRAITGQLNGLSPTQVEQTWQTFLTSPWQVLMWHSVFMFLTLWVVERGVQGGLEKASRLMMPLLFIMLIILDIYGATTPGFKQGVAFLFAFDITKITPSIAIAAMGHAFFTLAVGAGAMLAYGSYLPRTVPMCGAIVTVAALDVLVALLSGLAIFPIIFSHGLTVTAGPGLIFEVLPVAFANMPGGQIIASLFFLLFIFAAWTSSINIAEAIVVMVAERYTGSRVKASFIVGFIAWFFGIGSVLSFSTWKDIKIFHHWNFFGAVTDLSTDILLPIGGLLFAIFAGWIMHRNATEEELTLPKKWLFSLWLFLIRFIAPVGIVAILISNIIDKLN